ncbi:hypothetical protein H0H81_011037, partial [Sphagnurus paluster]
MDVPMYKKAKAKLLARSKTLSWLPDATNDRIWNTKKDPSNASMRPPGAPLEQAPR